jgi:hypothetical protein
MDLGDSTAYLRHHLVLAGRSDQLFADDAIVRLHRQSNGIPRALNNAAVAALIAAASDGKEIGHDACARKAVAELTRESWRSGGGVSMERRRHVPTQSCRIIAK